MSDRYKTIASAGEGLFKDKGSRFISFAWPVDSRQMIDDILDELRRKYHDARHLCYAWRIGTGYDEENRANDDGEPSGTAGRPILGQILSGELTNILVVVVRYFGGTKLGVPGLINAYRTAAAQAIDNAVAEERTVKAVLTVAFAYIEMNGVMKLIKDFAPTVTGQNFDNRCTINLEIRRNDYERFARQAEKINGTNVELHGYK